MMLSLRNFRFAVGVLTLLIALRLVWLLPEQGFFRVDMAPRYLPQNGMALVDLKNGVPAGGYPVVSWAIGWRALLNQWPLMLLCMLVSYHLRDMCLWLYRLSAPENPVPQEENPVPQEVSAKEQELLNLTEEQNDMLCSQALDLEDLRDELRQAQQELFDQQAAHGERQKTSDMYMRKTVSMDKDLTEARAKIKQLNKRLQDAKKTG